MNTKRLPRKNYPEKAEQAWQLFLETQPDLVILGDDNALHYLGYRLSETTTPVVYLGINNNPRNYQIHRSKNITGVLERPLIKRSIPIIAQLFPYKITHVLMMFDNSLTAHTILEEIFSSNTQLTISGIQVDIRLIGRWQSWQQILLTAHKYDAVFLGLFHTIRDKKGHHISEDQVLQWSAENTPIPPFGLWDFAIGRDKAIGGLVHFGEQQGSIAAEMARKILEKNIPPSQIAVRTAQKGGYLFSQEGLDKYNLTLPDSISEKVIFVD